MEILDFAKLEMKLKLSPLQQDLLLVLKSNPDGWYRSLRFNTLEMRQVRDVYVKWKESMLVSV